MKKILIRLALLILLFAVLGALFRFTPLGERLNLGRIAESRDRLLNYAESRPLPFALGFIALYIAAVALSVPGATVLSLSGGFFFGPWLATLYINLGATGGAVLIFLISRYFIGKSVQEKYGEKLAQFNREIDENGSNYLITLRLIPLFPFFLVNLMAGLTRIGLFTFFWTTSLGIIPGSFVYAWLGHAGASLTPGETGIPREGLIALLLLGAFSLIPVIYKKVKTRTA